MRQPVQLQKLEALILELFLAIEPMLIRYPSLDPASFREVVESFCKSESETTGDTAE